MSFKETIVNEIVKSVKTNEPIYKITYIMPEVSFEGDEVWTAGCCNIQSVIYNKSTYFENLRENCCIEKIKENWSLIIDKERKHHNIDMFNIITENNEKFDAIYLYKLSVELLN
jgi:hypothetical protein